MAVLVEVAVEAVESARRAEADGASRIELCENLAEGGVTPRMELLEAVRAAVALPIHVLVRPRAGNFVYTPEELAIMCRDVGRAREGKADGLVIGALTPDGALDRDAVAAL